jgi:hypothetical protein
MEELLSAAAAAMKMSEKMVQRSAEAKAKAQCRSVDPRRMGGVATPTTGATLPPPAAAQPAVRRWSTLQAVVAPARPQDRSRWR